MSILTNLNNIKENINKACKKVNRNPEEINIIGVTKYVSIERAQELLNTGVFDLGENRAEELVDKYSHLNSRAKFHFIGTLQSRKVKDVVNKIISIHSLDRLSVAKQINSRSEEIKDFFIQVNLSEEYYKHGLKINEVDEFINHLSQYEKVRIVGLMTMAPHIDDEKEIRSVFKQLATLRNAIRDKKLDHAPCEYLSMGMSNDYEIAIEEGATHIRLGSELVGS